MSPMISAPASRARATTRCGAGYVCGMPGERTSEGMSPRSALRRSTMAMPAAAAASRRAALSSHAITVAPPRARACAAARPDFPRPRTPTGMPRKQVTSIFVGIIATSPQFQRRQPGEREDRGDDPETDDDGRLLPALLLEMMVQRRHAEDAAAGQLEACDLD